MPSGKGIDKKSHGQQERPKDLTDNVLEKHVREVQAREGLKADCWQKRLYHSRAYGVVEFVFVLGLRFHTLQLFTLQFNFLTLQLFTLSLSFSLLNSCLLNFSVLNSFLLNFSVLHFSLFNSNSTSRCS